MILGHVKVEAENGGESIVVVLLEVIPPQIGLSSLKRTSVVYLHYRGRPLINDSHFSCPPIQSQLSGDSSSLAKMGLLST